MNGLRVCELFSGVGSFRYGLGKTSDPFQTVYVNVLDKGAASIYRCHRPDDGSLCEADLRSSHAKDSLDFDILCGGFSVKVFCLYTSVGRLWHN